MNIIKFPFLPLNVITNRHQLPINHNRAVLIKSFGKSPLFSALEFEYRFGIDFVAIS